MSRRRNKNGATDEEIRRWPFHDAATPGTKDPEVNPSRDAIRRCIAAQMCPWCHRGPFAMLPVHTNKMHGVDKFELRELAGLTTRDSLCSDDVRVKMIEYHRAHPEEVAARQRQATEAGRRYRRPQRWTTAGRDKNRATLIAWEAARPDEARNARRRNARLANTPELIASRAAATRAWWAGLSPEERAAHPSHDPAHLTRMVAAAQEANRRPLPEHGNVNRYKHHGCRCELCREAKRLDRQRTRK